MENRDARYNRLHFDSRAIDFDRAQIIQGAREALAAPTIHITDAVALLSPGTIHDYYSNGDYWWPNPNTPDGIPYIRRDGQTNPDNFNEHRMILRRLRTYVANLAAAYLMTGYEAYAQKAILFLEEFFIHESTKMNPHLMYAQAIPGICSGRGIGIIDTLHLIDIPVAIDILKHSRAMTTDVLMGLREWFRDYLKWMNTHEYGIEEMNTDNNHSVCWHVQAAVFAIFTGERDIEALCRDRYKNYLLPNQMSRDGSFPLELARTKPYSYSLFNLDNMVTLCHILSTPDDNLWEFTLEDGRSIGRGLDFLYPYIEDRDKWPYSEDVEHFSHWPHRMSFMLFAGLAFDDMKFLDLWDRLPSQTENLEVRRNIAIRQPILWLN